MRAVAKKVIETAAIAAGAARLGRRVRRRVAILAYHNVVPAGDEGRGDASLHIRLDRFLAQIERLSRTHRIIALDAIEDADTRDGKPLAAITFDDAYRGAVALALPELRRRGIPATMFVAPALLGTPSTWWDELGEAGALTSAKRRAALEEEAGIGQRVRARWPAAAPRLPDCYAIATVEELRAQCVAPITVGSHSWGHEYLPALGETELRSSLSRARSWLDRAALPMVDWIALPYGGYADRVTEAALDAGHRRVLRVEGGTFKRGELARLLPRINVPAGMSVRGFELRASGFGG